MLEIYSNLVSVGYQSNKPDALSKLERGEEPWTIGDEPQHVVCLGSVSVCSSMALRVQDAFVEFKKVNVSLQSPFESPPIAKSGEEYYEHDMFANTVNQRESQSIYIEATL
ncbi:zinc finger protein 432-like [Saccopteryx bilineata]|uniref:zinc finger protein 432-like n=1 Tax=Saccopteryx bilineata TaxID=59482 RepID=UPI0033904152